MAVRPIDANAMLSELRPVSSEEEHMLEVERIRMIAEVFRHYEIKQGDRA